MSKETTSNFFEQSAKHFLQYFLQGLVVLAPVGVTIYSVYMLFNFVDGILPNVVHVLFPSLIPLEIDGTLRRLPGLGFVVVLTLVFFVGRISSSFVMKKLVQLFDMVLENTPGIKFIYSSVKDFLEAFAGNKKKFNKPVLVNIDAVGVWRIGFITQDSAIMLGLEEHVIVYVPHSYAISGITFIIPMEKVRILPNISAADAMKFSISGGVTEL